jgi:hypothetical protein
MAPLLGRGNLYTISAAVNPFLKAGMAGRHSDYRQQGKTPL